MFSGSVLSVCSRDRSERAVKTGSGWRPRQPRWAKDAKDSTLDLTHAKSFDERTALRVQLLHVRD